MAEEEEIEKIRNKEQKKADRACARAIKRREVALKKLAEAKKKNTTQTLKNLKQRVANMREKQTIKIKKTNQKLITKRTSAKQQTKNKQKNIVKSKPSLKKNKIVNTQHMSTRQTRSRTNSRKVTTRK